MTLGTACCCVEEAPVDPLTGCECLDTAQVTGLAIQFREVAPPVEGTGPGQIEPGNNPATENGICGTCDDWNREWLVVHVQDCTFAEGQAGGGYLVTPNVYTTPGGGSACFPCAAVGENTGLTLDIVCISEEPLLVSATLTLVIDGCDVAVWTWEPFNPAVQTGKAADTVSPSLISSFPGDACYVPEGACKDALETFPACLTSGVEWYHDRHNCAWHSAEDADDNKPILKVYKQGDTLPQNPKSCDPCPDSTTIIDTEEFTEMLVAPGGSGTAAIINDAEARGGTAWRLCGAGPGEAAVEHKYFRIPARSVDSCIACFYIRYKHTSQGALGDVGEVWITQDDETGLPDLQIELQDALDDFDGPHATIEISGYLYEFLGCHVVETDSDIWIRVIGPNTSGDCLVFDDFVVKMN